MYVAIIVRSNGTAKRTFLVNADNEVDAERVFGLVRKQEAEDGEPLLERGDRVQFTPIEFERGVMEV